MVLASHAAVWAIAMTTAVYGIGIARLWHAAGAGRGVSLRQVIAYGAGMVTLTLALSPPVDRLADQSFAAHMTQHLLLICVAAPLVVLGHPIVAVVWAPPRAVRISMGRCVRAAVGVFGRPAVAWSIHLATLAFWHVPRAYQWALAHEPVHALEHAMFFATSCLFWWVVLPGARGRRLGHGTGVLAVAAMAGVMGIYGAVLTFARVPLYDMYPLPDQQLAGVIMWIPTGVVYLGAALWCFLAWMRFDEPVHAVR